jgi:hypothetical protein
MRTRRARLAAEQEPARLFLVEIADRAPAQGSLRVREPGGSEHVREVAGKDCAEVVSALALVIALVIDPNASTEPLPAAPPAPRKPAEPVRPLPQPVPAPQPSTVVWRSAAGLRLGAVGGIAPELAPELGLFVQTRLEQRSAWEPMFRLAFSGARSFEIEAEGGSARFTRLAGRLTFCPVRVPVRGPAALRPCLFGEAGVLTGAGVDAPQAASASVAWLAAGASVHAELVAGEWLLLGLEVDGILPAVRDRFYFDPRGVWEHRVPPFALGATLTAGVRLD